MQVQSHRVLQYLSHIPDSYQTANQRSDQSWELARQKSFQELKPWQRRDVLLADHRCASGPLLRGLIRTARILEELGEASSELSSSTEKLIRHILTNEDKFNLTHVLAAAIGRALVVGTKPVIGVLPKIVGAGLFGLSFGISLMALMVNKGGLTQHQFDRLQPYVQSPSTKPKSISRLIVHSKPWQTVRKKLDACRNNHEQEEKLTLQRIGHINYMSTHIHQYGKVTKGLYTCGHALFKVVNKTITPLDRLVGQYLAHTFKRLTGFAVANRLLLGVAAASSALITTFLLPAGVSLSTLGLCACGAAMLFLVAAKVAAHLGGWHGDLAGPVGP